MRRVRFTLLALLAPTLALAMVVATGCGGGDKDKGTTNSGDGDSAPKDGSAKGSAKAAIEGKGHGTLKGKVVLDGELPNMTAATKDLQEKMKAKDEGQCLADASEEEKSAFEWRVDPQSKGVANVIVWLAPPDANSYFKLSEAEQKPAEAEVVIDQPHCAFIPHVAVAFTHYNDGKGLKPTGQKVLFRNSSEKAHNTNYKGTRVSGANTLLNPGQTVTAEGMKPDQITLSCEIHPWMRAYIRDFDHPYAAVTGKDGSFEIKNVPTGVPLQLVYWHEKADYGEGGAKGQSITLKDGDNTKDLKVKPK